MATYKITVFDEENRPLVALYGSEEGGSMGIILQGFLKEMQVSRSFELSPGIKASADMGCLAAQIVKFLKKGPGGVHIYSPAQLRMGEYNYEIKFITCNKYFCGHVSLVCNVNGRPIQIPLYDEDILGPVITRRVTFVYDKRDGEGACWRTVDVTHEDTKYISGFEDGKFKKFLYSKIVGSRVFPA